MWEEGIVYFCCECIYYITYTILSVICLPTPTKCSNIITISYSRKKFPDNPQLGIVGVIKERGAVDRVLRVELVGSRGVVDDDCVLDVSIGE